MTNLVEAQPLDAGDGVLARWRATPIFVRLYFVCSLVAVALLLSIVYSRELHEWLLQWTGWSGLFCYMFGVTNVGHHLLTGTKNGLRRLPLLMAAFAGFGLIQHFILSETDRYTHTNPYLRVHPWRPLVTVALPMAWALLLYFPDSCRRWMKDAGSDAMGR